MAEYTLYGFAQSGNIYFPEEFGVQWERDFPNVGKWLGRISALKGWVHPYKLLPGHPLPGKKIAV